MRIRRKLACPGVALGLLLAAFAYPASQAGGAEAMETVREAFHASSRGLSSGVGKGTYRKYEADNGGEWQLKTEAEIETYFDGRKYHIALWYTKEPMELIARRIVYDGEAVSTIRFSPRINLTGAGTHVFSPEKNDHLCRPQLADFPWDVARLVVNVWEVDALVKNVGAERIEIKRTSGGDLVGSYAVKNSDRVRVRFECPRRFDFNIASKQVFNAGEGQPAQENRLEWKRGRDGVWFVKSLEGTFVMRDGMKSIRWVLDYSEVSFRQGCMNPFWLIC